MYFQRTSNCGTYELNGVREFSLRDATPFFATLRGLLLAARRELRGDYGDEGWVEPGIILFSDAKGRKRLTPTSGDRFAAFLRDNNLGTVIEGDWVKNPNTANKIKFWIWHVDATALRRFG